MERSIRSWLYRTPGARSAIAGIGGGIVMIAYEMVAMWWIGAGFWSPLQMIGATVSNGSAAIPRTGTGRALLGLIIHFITAGFWGTRFGYVFSYAPRFLLGWPGALLLGLVWGVVVWLVMGLIIGPALNPLLRDAHPTHYFVSHLVYGAVSALVLAIWARRVAPTVTPP